MYRISARQILVVAFNFRTICSRHCGRRRALLKSVSAGGRRLYRRSAGGYHRPGRAPDEQNNIEVYRKLSPGVVNVHSTSYARDFFGYVEPREGSGSGSVIDQEGHILTNHHVIEGAQKVAVSFGGQKNYRGHRNRPRSRYRPGRDQVTWKSRKKA